MIEDITVSHEHGDCSSHVAKIKQACQWAGVAQGRANEYAKLIQEFFERWDTEEDGKWRDRFLAFNESCEIIDIHSYWSRFVLDFPGLKDKLSKSLKKGNLVQEDENPDRTTNKPRNDAFVYGIAGKLLTSGIGIVAVDGVPRIGLPCPSGAPVDVDLVHGDYRFVLECKRIQGKSALRPRVKKARRQICKAIKEGHFGIVSVDLSVIIRPPATLLSAKTVDQAYNYIAKLAQEPIYHAAAYLFDDESISGLWGFARVPVILEEEYNILSSSGTPYKKPIPYSVASSIMVSNEDSPGSVFFKDLRQIVSRRNN